MVSLTKWNFERVQVDPESISPSLLRAMWLCVINVVIQCLVFLAPTSATAIVLSTAVMLVVLCIVVWAIATNLIFFKNHGIYDCILIISIVFILAAALIYNSDHIVELYRLYPVPKPTFITIAQYYAMNVLAISMVSIVNGAINSYRLSRFALRMVTAASPTVHRDSREFKYKNGLCIKFRNGEFVGVIN